MESCSTDAIFNKGMVHGARAGFEKMSGPGCLGTRPLATPRAIYLSPGLGLHVASMASSRGRVPFFLTHP